MSTKMIVVVVGQKRAEYGFGEYSREGYWGRSTRSHAE